MACSATSKNPADRLPIELSDAQRVGISRYEDLLLRMPRFEVAAIGQLVREHAKQICPGIEVVVCGSYRRGKSMSGDVDVLLAPPPGAEDFCDLESSGLRHTVLPRLLSAAIVASSRIRSPRMTTSPRLVVPKHPLWECVGCHQNGYRQPKRRQ